MMKHAIMGLSVIFFVTVLIVTTGCGGAKAFTKGDYDDPTKVVLLDDKFNEADMQQMAQTIVDAMVACPTVTASKKPPVVISLTDLTDLGRGYPPALLMGTP